MTYALLDSGRGEKLEKFGDFILIRPALQAQWNVQSPSAWESAHAKFSRAKSWVGVPQSWNMEYEELIFKLSPTPFGHLGFFPEHAQHWSWMSRALRPMSSVLNLFAYSGGATLYLAKQGHSICHVDASKGMVEWARHNALLNGLECASVRWIVDDTIKFLKREVKRKRCYDALILDPPSFGRGFQGQVFKIKRDLLTLLHLCCAVVSAKPSFVFFTSHTPEFTPKVLENLMRQTFPHISVESGEMLIHSHSSLSLPSGSYARCVVP